MFNIFRLCAQATGNNKRNLGCIKILGIIVKNFNLSLKPRTQIQDKGQKQEQELETKGKAKDTAVYPRDPLRTRSP